MLLNEHFNNLGELVNRSNVSLKLFFRKLNESEDQAETKTKEVEHALERYSIKLKNPTDGELSEYERFLQEEQRIKEEEVRKKQHQENERKEKLRKLKEEKEKEIEEKLRIEDIKKALAQEQAELEKRQIEEEEKFKKKPKDEPAKVEPVFHLDCVDLTGRIVTVEVGYRTTIHQIMQQVANTLRCKKTDFELWNETKCLNPQRTVKHYKISEESELVVKFQPSEAQANNQAKAVEMDILGGPIIEV